MEVEQYHWGGTVNLLTRILIKLCIVKQDLDYDVVRASMVVIFALFGYSKWFNYEAQALVFFITHEPLSPGCTRFLASGAPAGS